VIEISVDLGPNSYPIAIGHGLTASLPRLLAPLAGRKTVVVSNRTIWSRHGAKVEKALQKLGPFTRVLIPDGERYKDRRTLSTIHDAFVTAGLGRDGLVVAFGGGVVGDVTGFAAATYMRGVLWVQLPTTLLAMVDSSVGGKTGINHPRAKNLIGAFHQPKAVIADCAFLETLPARQLRSGAYEALKCGVIADRSLFQAIRRAPAGLKGWSRTDIESAVASACEVKVEIVEKDEREDGLRRFLNLGHTLGHALESVTGYRRFTHGEAVGWGLVGAAWIARRRGLLPDEGFDLVAAAVDHLGPRPRVSDIRREAILDAVGRDKKVKNGRLTFVLPLAIGRVAVHDDVDRGEVRDALRVMTSREARMA
jgi:3-dehydroquinate synthase